MKQKKLEVTIPPTKPTKPVAKIEYLYSGLLQKQVLDKTCVKKDYEYITMGNKDSTWRREVVMEVVDRNSLYGKTGEG